MAQFSTGNDAWDQGLGALSQGLFPDPSKVAQAGYYGAQQYKTGIEAGIEKDKWGNLQGLSQYIQSGGWRNAPNPSGVVDQAPGVNLPHPTPGTASNGPAASAPGLPPQLTAGTPPPYSPPSPSAPPAPNATTSNGQVPQNDVGSGAVHPATVMPGGGGKVQAPPAGPNGSPSGINMDLSGLVSRMLSANLTPEQQALVLRTLSTGYVMNGNVAEPTQRAWDNMQSAFGNTAPLQSRTTIATTAMQGDTSRAVANIQGQTQRDTTNITQAGETQRKGMDTVTVMVNGVPMDITRADFAAGRYPQGATVAPGQPAPAAGATPPPAAAQPGGNQPLSTIVTPSGGTNNAPAAAAPPVAPAPPAAAAPGQPAGGQTGPVGFGHYDPQTYREQNTAIDYVNLKTRDFKRMTPAQAAALPDAKDWIGSRPEDRAPKEVAGAAPGSATYVPNAFAAQGPPGQAPAPGQAPVGYTVAPGQNVADAWNAPLSWINQNTGETIHNTSRGAMSARPAQEQVGWNPASPEDLKPKNWTGPGGTIQGLTRAEFLARVPPDQRAQWRESGQTDTEVIPTRGPAGMGYATRAQAGAENRGYVPTDPNQVAAANQQTVTEAATGEIARGNPNQPLSEILAGGVRAGQGVGLPPKAPLTPEQEVARDKVINAEVSNAYPPQTGGVTVQENHGNIALPPAGVQEVRTRVQDLQRTNPRVYSGNDQLAVQKVIQDMQAEGKLPSPQAFSRNRFTGDFDSGTRTIPGTNSTEDVLHLRYDPNGGYKRNQPGGSQPPAQPQAPQAPPQGPPLSTVKTNQPPGTTGRAPNGTPFVIGPDGLPYATSQAISTSPPPPTQPPPTQQHQVPPMSSIIAPPDEGGFQGRGPGFSSPDQWDKSYAASRRRLATSGAGPTSAGSVNQRAQAEVGPRPTDPRTLIFANLVTKITRENPGVSPAEAMQRARQQMGG
jgi:hypothetical protein